MEKTTKIILCGVGGQGTVLASKLIAAAAMEKGFEVMSAETIGMAQKGGSVQSFLKVGGDIKTPLMGKKEADLIIGFEPAESVRMLPFLRDGGSVITSDRAVMPVTAALSGSDYNAASMIDFLRSSSGIDKLCVIDTTTALKDIGSPKAMNMVLLGAASRAGLLGNITHEDIIEAMKKKVRPEFVEMNIRALEYASL